MNDAERYKITSNEFADLIINYDCNMSIFNNFPDSSVNIIDNNFAVVHIPATNITPNSIFKYGYAAMPGCLALLSAPAYDSSGVSRIRNIPDLGLRGNGVLVGFIDTGINYMNQVFKNPDNTTRIISIWDQTIDSNNYPENFYYGTEYSQDILNIALKSENPLSIVPSTDEIGHGTMLSGVAAGSPVPEIGFTGIVPNAEFVIVKLKPAKPYIKQFFLIPEDVVCYQENDIMFGIKYLLQVARRLMRPIAICIGVGTSKGNHSGRSNLSRYLSSVSENTGTAFIVSAGNEGNRGHHYYGEKSLGTSGDEMLLNIGAQVSGFTMECWGIAPSNFWIDLYAPTGEFVSRIPPRYTRTIQLILEETSILVDSIVREDVTNEQAILFRFHNPMPGVWRFLVYEQSSDLPLRYHAWLPVNSFIPPGIFFNNSNNNTTITAPGNTPNLICITAYNYINQSLYYNASKGFTLSGYPKPDLAAPGVNLLSPVGTNQFTSATGTSIAAAHTTGVAAMLLEWGIIRGNLTTMNSILIKKLLIQGARRNPYMEYPNPDWGYGILDIYRTYEILKNDETRISEMYLC